jgi:hypothetical protein
MNVSPSDLAELRKAVVRTVELRDAYVRERGLDQAFCFGHSNWSADAPNDYLALYRRLRDCDEADITKLRPLSRNFTGYTFPEEIGAGDIWVRTWRWRTRHIPQRYRFNPPRLAGEIGPTIDGVVVNHDTYVCQERLNILLAIGVISDLETREQPIILEIGAGYGALALALTKIVPRCRYVICDLPESLLFSGLYLALADVEVRVSGPDDPITTNAAGVTLLPNYMFHRLLEPVIPLDLAINTLSMSEMSEHQVRCYSAAISRMIASRGTFFEQNQDSRHLGMLSSRGIIEPYFSRVKTPQPWRQLMPIRPLRFTQGPARLWSNAV